MHRTGIEYHVIARHVMSSPSQTSADLKIYPRNFTFMGHAPDERWWLGGDPVATAFFNALSASFPYGERFFMDSVRRYRDCTTGALKDQIGAFLSQEATHAREQERVSLSAETNSQIPSNGGAYGARSRSIKRFLARKPPERATSAARPHLAEIMVPSADRYRQSNDRP